jgi:carbamoyltransferase
MCKQEADRIFLRDSDSFPFHSPFMSFAPSVRQNIIQELPALAHVDGTARPQTVSKDSDPWMHDLLLAVKRSTSNIDEKKEGSAVLINTSFNVRGRPILNRVAEALELLRTSRELDMVVIEDWLFRKPDVLYIR